MGSQTSVACFAPAAPGLPICAYHHTGILKSPAPVHSPQEEEIVKRNIATQPAGKVGRCGRQSGAGQCVGRGCQSRSRPCCRSRRQCLLVCRHNKCVRSIGCN